MKEKQLQVAASTNDLGITICEKNRLGSYISHNSYTPMFAKKLKMIFSSEIYYLWTT